MAHIVRRAASRLVGLLTECARKLEDWSENWENRAGEVGPLAGHGALARACAQP